MIMPRKDIAPGDVLVVDAAFDHRGPPMPLAGGWPQHLGKRFSDLPFLASFYGFGLDVWAISGQKGLQNSGFQGFTKQGSCQADR